MLLEQFNEAPRAEAQAALRTCLDVPRWVDALVDRRPFATRNDLVRFAAGAAVPLSETELNAALSRHPRIGEPAPGNGEDAARARAEQAGVDRSSATVESLKAANRAYEQKFGRVFLIRAAGRGADEILAALHERLNNPPDTELRVVEAELRDIAVRRLESTVSA